MDEVIFENLEKGDRLIVETSDYPEEQRKKDDILIAGKRETKEGELKHLIVEFEDKDKGETLIAEMPGGFVKFKPEDNITKGIIRNAENNCLYFENVNYKDKYDETKSGKRRVRSSKSIRSMPIRKIVLIKEERES